MEKILKILLALVFLAMIWLVVHNCQRQDIPKQNKPILRIDLSKVHDDYEYIFFTIPSFQDGRDVNITPSDIRKIVYVYSLKKDKLMKFVEANASSWKGRKIKPGRRER